MTRLLSVPAATVTLVLSQHQTSAPDADAAFAGFFRARTAPEAAAASDRIVASGIGFDEAFAASPARSRLHTRRASRRRAGKLSQRDR